MDRHFLIPRAARTLSVRSITRISDEETHDAFRRIIFAFNSGEPYGSDCGPSKVYAFSGSPIRERRAVCLKKFSVTSGTLFHCPRLSCHDRPFPSPVVGITEPVLFGLSQLGLLHFGQTLGFSPFSRGNHSCPHRHRQPSSNTMPIWVSSPVFIPFPRSAFTVGIYDCSCIVNLLLVYTTGRGDRWCGSGRFNLGNGWGGKLPLAPRSSEKVASGLSRHSRGADTTQSALIRPSHTAPVPTTPRRVKCASTCLRCSS